MAGVEKRSGRWHLRYKDEHGKRRKKASRAKSKTEAKRMAEDLERRCERQRRGLEAMPPADGGGTLDALLEWWIETYAVGMASGASVAYMLRKHVIGSPIGDTRLSQVTSGGLDELLQSKAKKLSPRSLNHLRGYLVGAFKAAQASGRLVGDNPAKAVRRRKVPRQTPSYLKADKVPPMLAALAPRWRALFATAIYSGLRKGELFALRKTDVDLDNRLLTVAGSHERDTTKGDHADVIPIASELLPYLEQAIAASPSELVFPAPNGKRYRRDTNLAEILRSAMGRAGIVTGYLHSCRKKECGYSERAPDAALRRCPNDGRKLWPKPQVREIRFHH